MIDSYVGSADWSSIVSALVKKAKQTDVQAFRELRTCWFGHHLINSFTPNVLRAFIRRWGYTPNVNKAVSGRHWGYREVVFNRQISRWNGGHLNPHAHSNERLTRRLEKLDYFRNQDVFTR